MGDTGDLWRTVREADGPAKRARIEAAAAGYEAAAAEAEARGLELVRHSDTHYSLRLRARGYDLAIYPGNRRLYAVRKNGAPPPRVEAGENWTLASVVEAAARDWA